MRRLLIPLAALAVIFGMGDTCSHSPAETLCSEFGGVVRKINECADGIDNDWDGLADANDPDCQVANALSELDQSFAKRVEECQSGVGFLPLWVITRHIDGPLPPLGTVCPGTPTWFIDKAPKVCGGATPRYTCAPSYFDPTDPANTQWPATVYDNVSDSFLETTNASASMVTPDSFFGQLFPLDQGMSADELNGFVLQNGETIEKGTPGSVIELDLQADPEIICNTGMDYTMTDSLMRIYYSVGYATPFIANTSSMLWQKEVEKAPRLVGSAAQEYPGDWIWYQDTVACGNGLVDDAVPEFSTPAEACDPGVSPDPDVFCSGGTTCQSDCTCQ
jgi:hypothetical protein